MKHIHALVALSLTTAVMADVKTATGFYLGIEGGVANTTSQTETSATPAAGTLKTDSGRANALGGLFAGYGRVIDGSCFYVGGEVFGGLDASKVEGKLSSAANHTNSNKISRKNYYGLAARVGYFVTPSTLVYGRLGAEAGKWETIASVSHPGALAEKEAKGTKNRINFAPGVGMETFLGNNVFLRAEYSYLIGPKYTVTRKTGAAANATEDTKVKINQHRAKLALGYKF